MVPILVLLVLIVGVGVSVIALRNRTEHGIESGISSFRREMRALAPRRGESGSPLPDDHRPVEQDTGVHLLSDRPPSDDRSDPRDSGVDNPDDRFDGNFDDDIDDNFDNGFDDDIDPDDRFDDDEPTGAG